MFEIEKEFIDNLMIYDIKGDLCKTNNFELEISIKADENTSILLNLENVEYIDASGLGLLVTIYKEKYDEQNKMYLSNPNELIIEILDIVKLREIIPMFKTNEEAIKHHKNELRCNRATQKPIYL